MIYARAMTAFRNAPSSHEAIRTSLQARAVLDVLAKERSSNSHVLSGWLAAIGLGASSRSLADLLDRLERDDLVRLEQVDDFRVVHLRRPGGEVASGYESRDWIAKPELPE